MVSFNLLGDGEAFQSLDSTNGGLHALDEFIVFLSILISTLNSVSVAQTLATKIMSRFFVFVAFPVHTSCVFVVFVLEPLEISFVFHVTRKPHPQVASVARILARSKR